jgi:lipoprotein-releasing system permease protein
VPFALFLALKHIRRRLLQSIITILGVAVGVMVLVTALSLFNGFTSELIRSTLQATPHVTLTPLDIGSTFADDKAVMQKIDEHSEVVAVAPYLSTEVLMARRANSKLGIEGRQAFSRVLGIEPELEQQVLSDLPVLANQTEAIKNEKGIVLGSSLSYQLGVRSADEVLVNNLTQGKESFKVAGTFRVGNELIDSVLSFVSIPTLQAYLDKPGEISGYHIRVKDPEQASAIGYELGQATGLLSSSWQNIFSGLIDQLRFQKALTSVVVFLIVLVAAMGIANILILTVAEKTQDIGILRAMGATQGQIMRVFMYEGLLLGGTGTILGVVLGLLIGLYFTLKPFPLPGELYFITALPVQMQFFDFAWISLVSLATSVIAALVPARRASGLDPVKVLR